MSQPKKPINQNLTVPNALSVLRILIIPFFAWFFMRDQLAAAVVLLVLGRRPKYGMTKKQKDMIKGAVVGSFIAGDGGAVVGAMVAKEKHEGASSDPFGASTPSAAKDVVKGAAIGSIVAGDGGAIAGAMIAKEKHNQKNSK